MATVEQGQTFGEPLSVQTVALPDDPALQQVLSALSAEGAQALVVGGAVRNALLGEPISDIDTTAADMLADLVTDLADRGTTLAFAELKSVVKRKLEAYELDEITDKILYFPTLNVAGKEYRARFGTDWGDTDFPATWPPPEGAPPIDGSEHEAGHEAEHAADRGAERGAEDAAATAPDEFEGGAV